MGTTDIYEGHPFMFPDRLSVRFIDGEHVYQMLCNGCGGNEVIGKASQGIIDGLEGSVGFRERHDKCMRLKWEEWRATMRARRELTPTGHVVDADGQQDALVAD